jgi:hypothetical protein
LFPAIRENAIANLHASRHEVSEDKLTVSTVAGALTGVAGGAILGKVFFFFMRKGEKRFIEILKKRESIIKIQTCIICVY